MNFDTIGVAAIVVAAGGYLGWRIYTILNLKRGQSTCPGCGTCDAAGAEAQQKQELATKDTKSAKVLN